MKKEIIEIETAPVKKNIWKFLIIILIVLLLLAIFLVLAFTLYNYIITPKNETNLTNITDINTSQNNVPAPLINNTSTNLTNTTRNVTNPPGEDTPPETCTPSCAGKQCGGDGCGGSCGSCSSGICNSTGNCVQLINCTVDSNCSYLTAVCGTGLCNQTIKQCYVAYNLSTTLCRNNLSECDAVETCSGNSVSCQDDLNKSNGVSCSIGACQNGKCASSCTPQCSGKQCGDDGCEGTCPPGCSITEYCDSGTCKATAYFEANYYVDYLIDDCNTYNVSTRTCGNGNKQVFDTVQEGVNVVQAGQILAVRGGTYRESVTLKNSGTESQRITIRGYPNEEVIFDGSETITGWKKCTSQQECLGNENWNKIYYASFPNTTDALSFFLQDNRLLYPSVYPNLRDRFFYDDITNYLTTPIGGVGTNYLIDDRLEGLGGSSLIGSYVRVKHSNNQIGSKKILDYIPSEKKIIIEAIDPRYNPTKYSIVNHYNSTYFDLEGDYYVNETSNNGMYKIYLWPYNNVNLETEGEVTRAVKKDVFITVNAKSYNTIEGFIFQKSNGNVIYTQDYGTDYDTLFRNNIVRYNKGYYLLYLHGSTNFTVENSYFYENNVPTIILPNRNSGLVKPKGVLIRNNNFYKNLADNVLFWTCINCAAINNTVNYSAGIHNSGMKAYAGGENILFAENKFYDTPSVLAFQDLENMTLYSNFVNDGRIDQWSPMLGKLVIVNNLLDGQFAVYYPPSNAIFENNILDPSLAKPSMDSITNIEIGSWQGGYTVGHNATDRSLIFKNSPKVYAGAIRNPSDLSDMSHMCISAGYFPLIKPGDYLIHEDDRIIRTVKSVSVGWYYNGNYYTRIEVNEPFTNLEDGKIQIWSDVSNLNIDYHLKDNSIAVDNGTDMSGIIADLQRHFPAYNFYKDIEGNSRPTDGDNNGSAEWDVGPYEYQPASIPSQPLYSSSSSKQGFWAWLKSFFS